ncbi:hypothetical protein CC80DRAFT_505941 [Byssothecium circinans]|uniref:Uncharacterized protein n=1 Tax=Byssothecium circinans TaxID=147558 RepID=A0A6A5TR04_9PLEO|nr:hypothetical protein CC80DRAFT_505941 [Byssothecium circinans]
MPAVYPPHAAEITLNEVAATELAFPSHRITFAQTRFLSPTVSTSSPLDFGTISYAHAIVMTPSLEPSSTPGQSVDAYGSFTEAKKPGIPRLLRYGWYAIVPLCWCGLSETLPSHPGVEAMGLRIRQNRVGDQIWVELEGLVQISPKCPTFKHHAVHGMRSSPEGMASSSSTGLSDHRPG